MAKIPLSDILSLLRDTYPFLEPDAYIPYGNGYIFNLISKQDPSENKIANFCIVNPEQKKVSSCYSSAIMYRDKKFVELWKKRITVKKKIQHSLRFNFQRETELCHYGIHGQRWGVRNGPPYPLNQKMHDKVINRYEKLKKNENRVVRGSLYRNAYEAIEKLSPLSSEEKAAKTSKVNLANEQLSKKVLGDISTHRVFDESNPPKMIQGSHSIDDDLARVNPKFAFNSEFDGSNALSPTANNCGLCAFTYDLRRRGYDVTAKASVDGIQPRRVMQDIYKNAKLDISMSDSWYEFFEEMPSAYPEGARGILSLVNSAANDGHAVNFEIRGGKLMIIDAQCNDKHTAGSLSLLSDYDPKMVEIIRTDNLEVNMKQVSKVCNELTHGWEKNASRFNPNWDKKMHGVEPSLDEMCEMFGIDLDEVYNQRNK